MEFIKQIDEKKSSTNDFQFNRKTEYLSYTVCTDREHKSGYPIWAWRFY